MKKVILMIIVPFMIKAQTPTEKKDNEVKQAASENSVNASESSKKEALTLIESYHQRVIDGEPMSNLAKKYSEDPGSAKNGGRYDNVDPLSLVPEFREVALSLKPNEVSKVFQTQYGYHFMQLIARHGDLLDFRHLLVIPK